MAEAKRRVSPAQFITQVRQEIKKVTWPTRKETTMTVVAVVVFAFMLALYLLGIDALIDTLTGLILR